MEKHRYNALTTKFEMEGGLYTVSKSYPICSHFFGNDNNWIEVDTNMGKARIPIKPEYNFDLKSRIKITVEIL